MDLNTIKKGMNSLFFISVVAFIIFLVLFLINYYVVEFLPFLPSKIPVKGLLATTSTVNSQSFLGLAKADTPLLLTNPPLNNISTTSQLQSTGFTLSFDCYLNGTYLSTDVPRVLFYFSKAHITVTNTNLQEYIPTNNEETPSIMTDTQTPIITLFSDTNFIIYIDPVKNDLKLGVITSDGTKKYLEIASIMKNIPIRAPFKVTMVFGSTFVELYKDNKLVSTYVIGSQNPNNVTLNSVPPGSSIYTPIDFIQDTVQVGNIQYFDSILTSSQIRTYNNPISSFF